MVGTIHQLIHEEQFEKAIMLASAYTGYYRQLYRPVPNEIGMLLKKYGFVYKDVIDVIALPGLSLEFLPVREILEYGSLDLVIRVMELYKKTKLSDTKEQEFKNILTILTGRSTRDIETSLGRLILLIEK